jgi:hypothetical protein
MTFGIIDKFSGKSDNDSLGKDYAIYYYCYNGQVYPTKLGMKGE